MKSLIIYLMLMFNGVWLSAQVTSADLREVLFAPGKLESAGIVYTNQVRAFYSMHNYQPVWLTENGRAAYDEFCDLVRNSGKLGLEPGDYNGALLSEDDLCIVISEMSDTVIIEMKITDAAIHFFSDLAIGNRKPGFNFDGLKYEPQEQEILQLLHKAVRTTTLTQLVSFFCRRMPQIVPMMSEIEKYLKVTKDHAYNEERIVSTKVNSNNRPLCKKLFALGCTDTLVIIAPDSVIRNALKKAQEKFSILNDGVLRSTALAELNVPLSTRLDHLKLSVNYYRWLYSLTTQNAVIVVNIPAASLKVYRNGTVIMDMRLIVGKPSTPTPTLTSKVSEVILYPYWIVPSSIIRNEILPQLRKNPGYIDANNFQVLDKNARIMDPYKINWNAVSASGFPYVIRQSTGCDNALGLLKLNFYNPYTVYLHDTPGKSLFMTKKRFYSHGCMRMEKPMELGHLVLGDNGIAIDTLEQKGCLRNQAPVHVPATHQLPVIVWYNPVDVDLKDNIVFYEDVYKKFLIRPSSKSQGK